VVLFTTLGPTVKHLKRSVTTTGTVTTRSTSTLSPKQVSEPLLYGHITCGNLTRLSVDQATRSWTVSPTVAVHKYSPKRLVARVNYILYGCASSFQHNYCSFVPLHTKVCQFTRTERKASESGEVQRSLQNCGSSVGNLLHVTLRAPRIYNSSRFLENLWTPYLYISFT